MLFDSHAHLNDERFDEDREGVISSLQEKGVDLVVNPGACIKTSIESVELANKYDFIYAAVGVHPHDVGDLDDTAIDTLRKLATENEKVVAIGEIGLDYYYDNYPRDIQQKWFIKQIELANELKLPIIIHDRDAHGDTLEIIKKYKSPEIGCVLHCYSGSVELAREYVKMGCFIETDSPYMAPTPHRGKRNDPSLVQFVADTIAVEKGVSYETVCKATKENAKRFFGIE